MKHLILLVCVVPLFAGDGESKADHGESWSYNRTGPAYWGDLKPGYAPCGEGLQQTPIDLQGYQEGGGSKPVTTYKPTTVHLINNGHTIEQTYPPGSTLVLDGRTYSLIQFHFHLPSEHTSSGQHHAMELHLVHADENSQLAVLGIFLELAESGNRQITELWKYLPKTPEESPARADVPVNAALLLPQNLTGFRYTGSLTTPPCSENVAWYVMRQPIPVTRDQVQTFFEIIGINNRPIQPANGRVPYLVK
jgi:carbonic anhydrase